jgi:hypothetical protein
MPIIAEVQRPGQIAGAVAGVVRGGCEARVTGEVVGRGKPGQRAADDKKFRAEHVTDAGQAGDDRGVIVGSKDAGHLTINSLS